MKEERQIAQIITPSNLLALMGVTPADNVEGFHTAIPWKSKIVGQLIRSLLNYRHFLEAISKDTSLFGPFSIMAGMQGWAWVILPERAWERGSVSMSGGLTAYLL